MAFDGQTVLVTGAGGNLGRAVAEAFAALGARLVLIDLRRDSLEKAFGAETDRRLFVAANLVDAKQAADAVDAAITRFGRLDVVCNIAGGFRSGETVHETSDQTWNFLFDLNARTVLNMARAAVPAMLSAGAGKIVNVGAYAALRGTATMGAYIASKSAVIRLTESMSAELRERGINVNCVLPGTLDTPENRRSMPEADPSRWVAPADLAQAVVFLCSPHARAIHGASLPLTGTS